MWKSARFAFSLAFLALVPIVSVAHHGFAAHFDNKTVIRIEGTVKQFDFINPHGFLHIDSVNEAGEPVVWVCDLQAKTQLVRRGVDETLFTVGEPIVVEGYPARREAYGCEYGTGHFSDGSTFTMRLVGDKPQTQFAENERIPLAEGETRSIFGVWMRPGMFGDASGRGERSGDDSITPAGQLAVDAFDSINDNPVVSCEGGSPVRNWTPPGLATKFSQEGEKIYIYHESMDITRTVHMDLNEHPSEIEPSDMGHSIGRYEEDGTLVIDTAVFKAGVLSGETLNTDQMTMQERVSITEGTGDLNIAWTVYEPVYYSEPIIGSQSLQSTEKELIPYECIPGSPMGSYQ
ncbi:MAG: DUF6152 family protein [Arenicellaceae bacterium]|nr:DUF6152 family protein [Arenicellaceae bacterium]